MNENKLRRLAQVSILLALAGSIWAAFFTESCSACQSAATLIGTHYLGAIGACFYAGLSLLMHVRPGGRLAHWGVLSACGVHLVLVNLLLHEHVNCVPCIATAAGVLLAGGALICGDGFQWKIHVWPFFVAFLLMLGLATCQVRAQEQAKTTNAKSLLAAVSQTHMSTPEGKVLLIAFAREGCHYCEQFDRELLPVLKQRFGAALELQRRAAPKELPTPSFVIVGVRTETLIGLPSAQAMEKAVRSCF